MAFNRAGMLLVAVASLLYCQCVEAQFQVLSGAAARELELLQNPENLAIAARTGETVFINFTMPQMAAVVQEEVNAVLNCLPWLMQYPGGTIRWLRIQIDEFGNEGNVEILERTGDPPPRRIVTGEFNHIVNITRTMIVPGGEDPDSGIYQCEVCTDRDEPFQVCHVSNTTLLGIGSPPDINETDSDSGPDSVTIGPDGTSFVYLIGADFCLREPSLFRLTLECDIIDREEGVTPLAFPTPDRTWTRDDIEVYTAEDGESAADALDMSAFFSEGSNLIFRADIIMPVDQFIATNEGALVFTTIGPDNNLTTDEAALEDLELLGINFNNFRRRYFEQILGTWTCFANNSIGSDMATSVIRECGIDPSIPGCFGGPNQVLFPDDDEVVPVGCNICVPEGTEVVLDCTVQFGTPPIVYVWRDEEDNIISMNPTLRVSEAGNYSCFASNADREDVTETSVLAFSPRSDFSGELTNPFVGDIEGTGCDRLLNSSGIPAGTLCPFVGEQLDFSCDSEQSTALEIMDPIGNIEIGSLSINSTTVDNAEGIFSCRLSDVPGFCGQATLEIGVRVFDPARIDREGTIDGFGPGRQQEPYIAANVPVTLTCPSSGIDDPVNVWYRIEVNETTGLAQEVRVEAGGNIAINDAIVGESIITTLMFGNFTVADEGTYVCRATNIAGVDAAVLTVLTQPDRFMWVVGEFSACDPDCREGVRFRSVVCRSLWDDRVVPDDFCTETEPAAAQNCSEIRDDPCLLRPVWISGPFSLCSRGCVGGFRKRDVSCVVPRTGEVVDDYRCNSLRKPPPFDFCENNCCVRDIYARFCQYAGRGFCGSLQYKRTCCWTCGLSVLPY